ncbi:MAG: hypothetical protein K0R17_36 [Rariglobus sp.]|nr:hypothetical protein [Rariglobus sp.]
MIPPAAFFIGPDRKRPRRSRRGGFALLITITLLAFLVLLLVSLASLTRVETQVASNSAQLAQARANALFALNLAVGQLQKYAGPDQAVTARADINAVNTGNPYWTGVWDARPPSAATPTHAAPPASNAPMAWLVSGNESNGTALTPEGVAVPIPGAGNESVWLLQKVLGRDLTNPSLFPVDTSIRLSKSPIMVPASQVPGADATGAPVRVGSYAWWVGDEGIKAKINLEDPYRTAAADSAEAGWRRGAAPRPDLQLLAKPEFAGAFSNPTAAFEASRENLLSYEQLPMLHADLAAETAGKQASGYLHDLTSVGYGVLADTLRGGLRRDLTRGLAAAPLAGSTAATEIGDGVEVFTLPTPGPYGRTARLPANAVWTPSTLSNGGTKNGEPLAPTWSEIRAWCAIRAPGGNAAIDPVAAPLVTTTRTVAGNTVTCPTTTGHAIMPVVVMLELGYGLDVGVDSQYRIMVRPRVVLMNPYNVTLNTATYSVIYQSYVTSNSDLTFTMALDATHSDNKTYFLTSGAGLVAANPISGVRQLSFNIKDSFGPGEVRVYSLPASATSDVQVNNGIFDLEPGLSTNRAYLATGTTAPSWYDPALRKNMTVTWAKIPADSPRIGIALGGTSMSAAPAPSLVARYLQTSSSILYGLTGAPFGGGKNNPTAKLESSPAIMPSSLEPARQMRTVRFTLRHADLDILTFANSNMSTEGETGAGVPTDSTSGERFLVDGNPRAIVSQRLGGRDNVAQYMMSTSKGSGYTDIDYEGAGSVTLGFWGSSTGPEGSTRAILFDVLRQNEEIVSLGRLGQVNWGVDGKHPAYPLGNSFASVFYASNTPDYGYALNEAMWDRFFMSTLPVSLATRPANLPNSRLQFHDPAGAPALASLEGMNGYQLAATRLMVDGAFNINSTSVEAWTAFLGSVQAADYAYQSRAGARTDPAVRAFPRMVGLHDPDPAAAGQSGNLYEWTGYRQLDATQLRSLATQVVAGIKARARPARSLAEFINRDLSQPATSVRNQAGIVQAAINTVVNTDSPDATGSGTGLANLSGLNTAQTVPTTFGIADNPDAAHGKLRSTGAPGFLLQSDLLSLLSPAMAARSDTFRVRTYGEACNPVTGAINGRAWCEAVVQRMPEFVDQADTNLNDPAKPTTALGNATAPASTNATNQAFGRKFVIVQFRWLGPDEI